MTDALVVEKRGGVALWRINQPELRNPLSLETKRALAEAARELKADPSLKVAVLTGTGKAFCAGGDLRSMDTDNGPVATRERLAETHAIIEILVALDKPLITAVNGIAAGAGVALAALGDIIVASEAARFTSGFPKVGVMPDCGIMYTLPKLIGMARAKDFLMTVRSYDAAEAERIGLVSRVLPEAGFLDAVMEIARGIAEGPGVSIGLTKEIMNASVNDTWATFLLRESTGQAVTFGSRDFREGVQAFRDKRTPRFESR